MAYPDGLLCPRLAEGRTRHEEALSIGCRGVPHSSCTELWRRSGSDPPDVHERHGGRHRSDSHFQSTCVPLSRHGRLLFDSCLRPAKLAARGCDLGSVLRLLACHGANYQPDRRWHSEPHAAFLSCRGTCRGYVGADLALARAEQRRGSTENGRQELKWRCSLGASHSPQSFAIIAVAAREYTSTPERHPDGLKDQGQWR